MVTITDALKGFDFSPWGGIEGFLEASKKGNSGNTVALKRSVPDLARAVDMTATAICSLPFSILDDKGEIYDDSESWENKLGGLANPQRLFYLLASSLCGGEAYIIPRRTPRMIYDLQYIAPHTIHPYIDMKGLQWFDRATDAGKAERIYPDKLIYFWLPDSDVELGPAENHPLGNAAMDAELILNMKNTMRVYGERGFVPITLLGAKGMPAEGERQKAEKFFDRLLKGGFDVLAKIINSEALSLIKVGAGMDELKGSYIEIKREAAESVFKAFGIPSAMAMSDNAFASEFKELRKTWYTASRFISIYQTIEETFTDQILKPYKFKLRFNLEALDMFQEDEKERAGSLQAMVSAITESPVIAKLCMEILGYDLDQEQQDSLVSIIETVQSESELKQQLEQQRYELERQDKIEQLRLRWSNKYGAEQSDEETQMKKEEAQLKENLPKDSKELEEEPKEKPEEDDEEEEKKKKQKALTADEIKDLALWQDKALSWFRKGKGSAVDWENKHLSEEIAGQIRLKLSKAASEEEIKQAFELKYSERPFLFALDYMDELKCNLEYAVKAMQDEEE